jgi:hypothetical protein
VSETALRSAIVAALNASGLCHVWSVHCGRVKVRGGWMHLSPVGTPDICGYTFRSGRFVGIEIKVAGHRTDKDRAAAQAAFQADIQRHGGISGQVTSAVEAVALLRAAFVEAA